MKNLKIKWLALKKILQHSHPASFFNILFHIFRENWEKLSLELFLHLTACIASLWLLNLIFMNIVIFFCYEQARRQRNKSSRKSQTCWRIAQLSMSRIKLSICMFVDTLTFFHIFVFTIFGTRNKLLCLVLKAVCWLQPKEIFDSLNISNVFICKHHQFTLGFEIYLRLPNIYLKRKICCAFNFRWFLLFLMFFFILTHDLMFTLPVFVFRCFPQIFRNFQWVSHWICFSTFPPRRKYRKRSQLWRLMIMLWSGWSINLEERNKVNVPRLVYRSCFFRWGWMLESCLSLSSQYILDFPKANIQNNLCGGLNMNVMWQFLWFWSLPL